MDFIWAAKQLQEGNPVRRKSWGLGEYVGSDHGLFWCCAHEETYNYPSVTIDYIPRIEDFLANDWEAVKILPAHKWKVIGQHYRYAEYFNYEHEAKAYIKAHNKYEKYTLEKVPYNEKAER
jgi:hypothetical protein